LVKSTRSSELIICGVGFCNPTYFVKKLGVQFEKDFIHQLLSEDIMQESVIYQDILQKGERIGEQRGELKGELKFCLFLLNQRFGEIDSLIVEKVKGLPVEQLENLGAALFNISEVADLVTWLNQQDH
jgi:predicted transposase YdaD